MSEERISYALRAALPAPADGERGMRILSWDDEAQRNAARAARRAALRDPDAAAALTAQLVQQPLPAAPSRYNPTELYAKLLHAPENLKPHEIDQMDYARFFGLVREISLLQEREQDEYERMRQGQESAYPMAHRQDQ